MVWREEEDWTRDPGPGPYFFVLTRQYLQGAMGKPSMETTPSGKSATLARVSTETDADLKKCIESHEEKKTDRMSRDQRNGRSLSKINGIASLGTGPCCTDGTRDRGRQRLTCLSRLQNWANDELGIQPRQTS